MTANKGKVKKWGRFKTTPRHGEKLFMIRNRNMNDVYHQSDEGFPESVIDAMNDSIRGSFEGYTVFSFTQAKLSAFLSQMDLVVVERYGSSVDRVEYVQVCNRSSIHLPDDVQQMILDHGNALDHPFEIQSFDGESKNTFAYIAARILGPALKRKIILSVPHGGYKEYSPSGAFEVVVWSTSHSDSRRNYKPPASIWGIDVDVRDAGFRPSSNNAYGSMLIMDNDYIVAELLENALYINHDVVHFGSEGELRIFSKLLSKVAELLMEKKEFAQVIKDAQEKYEAAQKKILTELVTASIPKRVDRYKDQIEKARRNVEKALKKYFEKERAHFNLAQAVTDTAEVAKKFTDEFVKLKSGKVNGIATVSLSQSSSGHSQVVMETKDLTALNKNTGKTHLLGRLYVSFDLDEGTVYFVNRDRTVNRQPAPHVSRAGYACWGNIKKDMAAYIAHYEIEAAGALVIAFLQTGADDNDEWGSAIKGFPEVDLNTEET